MEDIHLSKQNLLSLVAVLSIAAVDPAYAQDQVISTTESESNQVEADSAQVSKAKKKSDDALETMVVTATRSEINASLAPANVSVINTGNTENRLTQRIGDALKEVPGVYLRGSAYGTSSPGTSMGSSSFHGISGSNRSLFLVDGLPVNNGSSGGVDWNILNIDDAQQVEYVPGPFSALYGSGAMGGVLNVISKKPMKREGNLTIGAGGGAVDQYGVKGSYRDRFANGLGISLTVNHMDSDNWAKSDYVTLAKSTTALGANPSAAYGAIPTTDSRGNPVYLIGDKGKRPWEQNNASLHLYYDLTPNTEIDGGMGWSRGETSDTGSYNSYLTNANGSPFAIGLGAGLSSTNVNLNNTGKKYSINEQQFLHYLPSVEDSRRYFGHLKHDFGHDVKLNIDFQYMENLTYSPSPNSTANNASLTSGVGQLTETPSQRIDGNVALRFPLISPDSNFVTVGFGANHNTLEAQKRVALSNWRNWDSETGLNYLGKGESSIYSAYIQDEWWMRKNLIAHLGVRYDDWTTSGSVLQTTIPTLNKTYNQRSVSQFNPKFSLTWLPMDGYKLFASTGWAFRPPTNFDLYSTTQTASVLTEVNPSLKPETLYSWEVGGEAKPIEGTTIAASYFHHYISDLIYSKTKIYLSPTQTLTQKQNAGEAEVEGVEVKFRQKLYWDWLHFNGTYTLNDSMITKNTASPASVGKQMVLLPKTMFSGGLDVKYDKWSGGIIGRYVGKQFSSSYDDNSDTVNRVFGSYDPYFLVDTRINFQAIKNVNISFSVNNLLDREYFSYYRQAGRTVYGEVSYSF